MSKTYQELVARPINLLFKQAERMVFVHAPDGDRWGITVGQAIQILAKAEIDDEQRRRIQAQFEQMIVVLHQKMKKLGASVKACYGCVHEGSLTAFVVPVKDGFDFELAPLLADVVREMGRQFPEHHWEICQIPASDDDDMSAFFDPEFSVKVFPGEEH
ncbi:MAG: hypothetical protein AAB074_02225 [Planctomycetota bacterium]